MPTWPHLSSPAPRPRSSPRLGHAHSPKPGASAIPAPGPAPCPAHRPRSRRGRRSCAWSRHFAPREAVWRAGAFFLRQPRLRRGRGWGRGQVGGREPETSGGADRRATAVRAQVQGAGSPAAPAGGWVARSRGGGWGGYSGATPASRPQPPPSSLPPLPSRVRGARARPEAPGVTPLQAPLGVEP